MLLGIISYKKGNSCIRCRLRIDRPWPKTSLLENDTWALTLVALWRRKRNFRYPGLVRTQLDASLEPRTTEFTRFGPAAILSARPKKVSRSSAVKGAKSSACLRNEIAVISANIR